MLEVNVIGAGLAGSEAAYQIAKKRIKVKNVPPFIEYGYHVCTILSGEDNIYHGVSVTSSTAINSNAEKNAILMMFNEGETVIKKMVILNELEEVIPPTEDCLNYMIELNTDLDSIEVLLDYDKEEVTTLKNLLPDWWGTYRNKKE